MKIRLFNKKLLVILFVLLFCIALPFTAACGESVDGEKTTDGEFYTMQQAYDEGFLTFEELLSIAYYKNGGTEGNEELMGESYAPITKSPETLSDYTKNSIRQSMANDLNEAYESDNYTSSNVGLSGYHGTYGNGVAVTMIYLYDGEYGALNDAWGEYIIEGVTFSYGADTTFFNKGDFTFDNHVMLWMPKAGKNGLTDEQNAEVEQAWNSQNECTLVWYDEETNTNGLICLGVYNGYIVLYDDYGWQGYDVACVITEKNIGGYVFEHNYPFALYAYANGVFNDLEEVYRTGNLTDSNIAAIYSVYNSYNL